MRTSVFYYAAPSPICCSMNKLIVIHRLAAQFDRVVGPRHPWLVLAGCAMQRALAVRETLEGLGYHLETSEAEAILITRRNAVRARGGAAGVGGD